MITEDEFKNALSIIMAYTKQVEEDVRSVNFQFKQAQKSYMNAIRQINSNNFHVNKQDTKIKDLDCSVRLHRLLNHPTVKYRSDGSLIVIGPDSTLQDISILKKDDLFKIPEFGKKAYEELSKILIRSELPVPL